MLCRSALFLLSCLAATAAFAEDNWPRFRGPNGSGIAESKNPPVQIQLDSAIRWKVAVPKGVSSPCIWGKRLFLTAFEDGKLWTLAYDRDDGHELWRAAAPAKQIEKFHAIEGSPAASTCATDGKRVVSYFGSCGILCYDLEGHPLWKYELPTAETAFDFGTGTSPIIADGLVILVRDVTNGPVVFALDAETGEQRWKTERTGALTAFSTPIVAGQGKDALLIAAGALQMKAYDLHSGKERWLLRGLPTGNCTLPVVGGERVFFAGWSPGGADSPMPSFDDLLKQYDTNKDGALQKAEMEKSPLKNYFDANDPNHDGTITREEWEANFAYMKKGKNSLFAFSPKGEGDITDTAIAWKHTKGLPYVPSPLYYRGRIFLVRDGGMVSCFDAETGKPVYESKRLGAAGSYYASPIAAGGHLYIVSLHDGMITVINAAGDQPEAEAQRKLDERVAATPAIVGDRMYLRSDEHLYCFGALQTGNDNK
jgi:outer membrane protein assembly factor BamB